MATAAAPPAAGAPALALAGHGPRDHLRHHHAEARAQAQAGRVARAAGVVGGRLDAARGLEGHVLLHVADGAHAGPLVDHLLHFLGRRDGADEEVDQLHAVLAEVVGHPGLEAARELVVVARQVEDGLERLAHQVGQARHADVAQEVLDRVGGGLALGADQLLHEQVRVGDLHREAAEGAQAHHRQLRVAVDDRLLGAPLQVGVGLPADEVDLGLEGRGAAEGQPDDLAQQRQVQGRERVAPRPEHVQGLAVAVEDRRLVLLDDQLRAQLDRRRAVLRLAVHDRVPGVVEVLQDLDRHLLASWPAQRTPARMSSRWVTRASSASSSSISSLCRAAALSGAATASAARPRARSTPSARARSCW